MCRTSTTPWPEQPSAALLAGTLLLAACSGPVAGPEVTQQRDIGAFDAIDLRGAGDLDVHIGPAAPLRVTGTARALANLETRVRGNTLMIQQKGGWFWLPSSSDVEIHVTLPQLSSVILNGAGDVDIGNLAGGELALTLQGAGNLEAEGRVDTLRARINGAGNMDLSDLAAQDATVSVNGAGNLRINATASLAATVNGVGSIRYRGKPAKVDTTINGVGSIAPEQ
ncbi:MAG: head GIN domain-containing protein [Steroidobacteraceae bacterium]